MTESETARGPVRLPRTLLIANRGEIVARIARTCRQMGIRPVTVAATSDRGALHTRVCDETVVLAGASAAQSYLDIEQLLDAAARLRADAVHPGFGFLAEDAGFARAVIDAGLTWVGPPPEVIAAMGDKLAAKRRMAEAGVPTVPGASIPDEVLGIGGAAGGAASRERSGADGVGGDARSGKGGGGAGVDAAWLGAIAEEVGYPLLVKAAAGGGGKGMRAVHDAAELVEAVLGARREASGAFGDARVFLERLIERPRHVEVQVLGDRFGTLLHLFERECSIQRRHQKVLEESPSPGIDEEVRAALTAAAVRAGDAIGYENAGTVEFVVDEDLLAARRAGQDVAAEETFAFLEVNTRLQVEHPVTEEVVRHRSPTTGLLERIDLVREQLLVAASAPLGLAQDRLVTAGHAIEVRLYAEDPRRGDLPSVGTVEVLAPGGGDAIRWELGVAAGDVVPSQFDPMLAKVIAQAPSRLEAAGQLASALEDTDLLGVTTNRGLLVALLRDGQVLAGDTTTGLLAARRDELLAAGQPDDAEVTRAAIVAAVRGLVDARAESPVLATLPAGFANAGTLPMVVGFTVEDAVAPGGVGAGPDGAARGERAG
ncbi:MAG: hypothetical protein JJT89_14875, partial [Nitriliruptoraceae bacterium]|nr:hypothetical protein [Nitriliruptoraceae bacterium]